MADFVRGNPQMVPYVPSADVVAGDIEVLGNTAGPSCGIFHHAFANAAADGEIAIGGGIYKMTPVANYAAWTPVSVSDAANNIVSSNVNAGPFFGYTVEALVVNTYGEVLHDTTGVQA